MTSAPHEPVTPDPPAPPGQEDAPEIAGPSGGEVPADEDVAIDTATPEPPD